MTEEQIAKVNEWFDEKRGYKTYHDEEEYGVAGEDVGDFAYFLKTNFPSLHSVPVMLYNDASLFFTTDNLKSALIL